MISHIPYIYFLPSLVVDFAHTFILEISEADIHPLDHVKPNPCFPLLHEFARSVDPLEG